MCVCVLGKIFQLRDKKLPDTLIYELLEILGSRLITRPRTLKQPRGTPWERMAMRAGFRNQTLTENVTVLQLKSSWLLLPKSV